MNTREKGEKREEGEKTTGQRIISHPMDPFKIIQEEHARAIIV
tara:strand:- start:27 stop:155 length:129 start_codon:yes stop_codon:yes gene_type:complete